MADYMSMEIIDQELARAIKRPHAYGKSALVKQDSDEYAKVAAWFLGPKGENAELLYHLLDKSMQNHIDFRRTYFPDDPEYVTNEIKNNSAYTLAVGDMQKSLVELFGRLNLSVPFFSPRYQAHMNWDTVLPGSLGYIAAILYNQNNVATEGGPATSALEKEVGEDLCSLLGFNRDSSWGHITADGTIANLEAMWMARNLKFYPLSVWMLLKDNELPHKEEIVINVNYPEPAQVRLIDLTPWQLLNISGDQIVGLAQQIKDRCCPEKNMETISSWLHSYLIQNLGILGFNEKLSQHGMPIIKEMKAFVPATKHYSWPKAGTILGIGQDSVVGIPVDDNCRMDLKILGNELSKCVEDEVPVLMVVAVIGSTEEGAMDDLESILELRDKYEINRQFKGLNFIIHCDAAWGGYLTTMIRDKRYKSYREGDGYVPALPLSDHAITQLSSIQFADTVTIDPHKAGFIPYPAGSLCYRNKAMREVITFNAAYIHSNPDTNMGIYGVEGSKPGASAAAVWMAHRTIPLNNTGYGRILGECMYSAKIYYCYWLTLASEEDNFLLEPLLPLPTAIKDDEGDIIAQGEEDIKAFIRSHIIGHSNEEIAADKDAMAALRQIGSDVLTNAFVVNIKDSNLYWNSSNLDDCKNLNIALFNEFSIIKAEKKDVPLILTLSELNSKPYKVALERICTRLNLDKPDQDDYSLNFLINTILDPWPTTHEYVNFITTAFKIKVKKIIDNPQKPSGRVFASQSRSRLPVDSGIKEPQDLVKAIPADLNCSRMFLLDVRSFTGYVEVSPSPQDYQNKLFYWFFESKRAAKDKDTGSIPLVIWLNGGPGASSLAGLFLENGPVHIRNDYLGTIKRNYHSWNDEAHLLYWDQPVGTGFSTTSDENIGYVKSEDELSEQFYTGLQGFFDLHKEYRACPLYITGESYAGKYIPFIASKISEKNKAADPSRRINLKGLAIGDGWMNPKLQTSEQIKYGFAMGFVDSKQREIAEAQYSVFCKSLEEGRMKDAFDQGTAVSDIVVKCGGKPNIYDVRRWKDLPLDNLKKYLDLPQLKDAIHLPQSAKWQFADSTGPVSDSLMNDMMADMTSILPGLVEEYRILMYTGNFDMSCGFTGTEIILSDMDWPGANDWRELYRRVWIDADPNNPRVLGYVKGTGNLMQVNIPNSGHLAAHDKPGICQKMIFNWLSNREFPGYDPLKEEPPKNLIG
jgi:vitellogenic carboxypeptidase-like protein